MWCGMRSSWTKQITLSPQCQKRSCRSTDEVQMTQAATPRLKCQLGHLFWLWSRGGRDGIPFIMVCSPVYHAVFA